VSCPAFALVDAILPISNHTISEYSHMSLPNILGSKPRSAQGAIVNSADFDIRPGERLIALSIMYQSVRQDKANNVLAESGRLADWCNSG